MDETLPYPFCVPPGIGLRSFRFRALGPEPPALVAEAPRGSSPSAASPPPPASPRDWSRRAISTAATCLQWPLMVEKGGQLHSDAKPPGVIRSETR